MPAVVLSNLSYSTYGKAIFTEIIEKSNDLEIFPIDFTIFKDQTYYVEQGVNNDIFNNIVTSRYQISMKLEENTQFLFDALTDDEAEEGEFFVRVREDGTIKFIGKIMLEAMEKEDRIEPAFTFTAIDTLTDLKNIPFNYDGPQASAPYIRNVIAYVLRQLPTDFLLDDSTIRYAFSSDIVPNNSTFYTDNLLENIYNINYYSEIENNVTVPLNCWDVLVEVLSRLNLHCRYQIGLFYIIGLETIHLGSETAVHYYDKDGDLIASDPSWTSGVTDFNFNNKCLVGGKYNFESGYKAVRIEGDRRFSNKKQGAERVVLLGVPTPSDSLFNYVGVLSATRPYKLRVKVKVTESTVPSGSLFTFLLSTRTTINGVSTNLLVDKTFLFPLETSEYIITEDIAVNAADRQLDARFKLLGSPTFKVTVDAVVAEDLLENDKVAMRSLYEIQDLSRQ